MPCYAHKTEFGGYMFINGDLGPHCADCMDVGEFLCDYPVGHNKTCDRPVCSEHSKQVGDDIHYCISHYKEYRDFRLSGEMAKALVENHR